MGQKGTGRRLSDQERIEIIAKLEGDKPRASAAECARQYGVSSAAITKLMKMKDKVKLRFQENNAFSQMRKRGGTERHAAFEDELFQWITAQQQEHAAATAAAAAQLAMGEPIQPVVPLTSARVQEKAQELLKVHELGTFRASKGWYYRFCRRYGLSRSTLIADDGDDDDHALEHGGGSEDEDEDASMDDVKAKRKEAPRTRKPKLANWAVQSLQDTLAKAAMALDHPDARQYLGEPAACEMLRSIQQSIGVVQCIRLKKVASNAADVLDEAMVEAVNASTESETASSAEDQAAAAAVAVVAPGEDVVV